MSKDHICIQRNFLQPPQKMSFLLLPIRMAQSLPVGPIFCQTLKEILRWICNLPHDFRIIKILLTFSATKCLLSLLLFSVLQKTESLNVQGNDVFSACLCSRLGYTEYVLREFSFSIFALLLSSFIPPLLPRSFQDQEFIKKEQRCQRQENFHLNCFLAKPLMAFAYKPHQNLYSSFLECRQIVSCHDTSCPVHQEFILSE